MAENKTYWPRSGAKKIQFQNGGSMLKLNFHVSTAIEWLRQHANDAGYITIGVTERRSPSDRGDTHCLWLDTWKPDASKARETGNAPRQSAPPKAKESDAVEKNYNDAPIDGQDDEVPF